MVRGASSRRETASTARNATSSRSHQVLQIRVLSKNVKSGQTLLGIMNMVDLAGSERITGAHDEARIKEAQVRLKPSAAAPRHVWLSFASLLMRWQ